MTFGGVEAHVEKLATGLAARGHKIFVYTRPWYTPRKKKTFEGVKLISLPSIHSKNLDAISHTFLAGLDVLRRDYDIVHYHGVGPALLAWIPRLFKPATKVIVTFHSVDRFHQKWGLLARVALYIGEWAAVKFAHDTITVSKVLQMYVSESHNADTIYIPNGVDIPKKRSPKLIKKMFGLKKDEYILFLSRLIPHKGTQYLIDAYNKINPKQKLVIAGGGSFTDDYVKFLQKKAAGNPNIIFTGQLQGGSELWSELYSNACLFVHPSEREGLPIVVLEAMSFGLGVLTSDIPESMEAIAGGHGFSFKNKSVPDLTKKLRHLLNSPELVRRVGAGAQQHVRKNYNWEGIVVSVETVYKAALGFRPASVPVKKTVFAKS